MTKHRKHYLQLTNLLRSNKTQQTLKPESASLQQISNCSENIHFLLPDSVSDRAEQNTEPLTRHLVKIVGHIIQRFCELLSHIINKIVPTDH